MQECDTLTINFPSRDDPTDVILFLDDSGNPGFTLRPERNFQFGLNDAVELAQIRRQTLLDLISGLNSWLSALEKQQAKEQVVA